jgi:hypothetical protein
LFCEPPFELVDATFQVVDLGAEPAQLVTTDAANLGDRVSQPVANARCGFTLSDSGLPHAAPCTRSALSGTMQHVVCKFLRSLARQRARAQRALKRSLDRAPDRVLHSARLLRAF